MQRHKLPDGGGADAIGVRFGLLGLQEEAGTEMAHKKANPSGVGLKPVRGLRHATTAAPAVFWPRPGSAAVGLHQLNRAVHAAAETAGIKKRAIQGGHPQHAGNGFLTRGASTWCGVAGKVMCRPVPID